MFAILFQRIIIMFFVLALAVPAAAEGPRFELLLDSIQETGLGRDAIPPVDRPDFISVEDAAMILDSSDPVFIYEGQEDTFLFPQQIMVWHEIVNLRVDGERLAITYSPLTGSIAAFETSIDVYATTMGNTGSLLNNNLIMYDRSTDSRWPQLFGIALDGALEGTMLRQRPLLWSTWRYARAVYPGARVLSPDTGYRRQYGRDPYGSYHREGTYYDNSMIVYPLVNFDQRMHPKTRMLCVRLADVRIAMVKDVLKADVLSNLDVGLQEYVAMYDASLDTVRVFERELGQRSLTFHVKEGRILDNQTKTEWSVRGRAIYGKLRGEQLKPVPAMDCMWFAWAAFYPNTLIYPPLEDQGTGF